MKMHTARPIVPSIENLKVLWEVSEIPPELSFTISGADLGMAHPDTSGWPLTFEFVKDYLVKRGLVGHQWNVNIDNLANAEFVEVTLLTGSYDSYRIPVEGAMLEALHADFVRHATQKRKALILEKRERELENAANNEVLQLLRSSQASRTV